MWNHMNHCCIAFICHNPHKAQFSWIDTCYILSSQMLQLVDWGNGWQFWTICVNSAIKILCKHMITYFSFLNFPVINLQPLRMGHIFLWLEQMPDEMHVFFLVNMMYFNIYNTYVLDKNSQHWWTRLHLLIILPVLYSLPLYKYVCR